MVVCHSHTLAYLWGQQSHQLLIFLPLISRCERRLISTSTFLSQARRLELTNAVFTSLSMFYLCTFKMHKTVIKQVDKYRKHCLWRGGDINNKSPPKAAWEMICLPKSEGGLGVLNLRIQNEALLLKYFDKFYNRKNHSMGPSCPGKIL